MTNRYISFETETITGSPVDLSRYWRGTFPVTPASLPIPFVPNDKRDNLLSLHATLQDALTWLDEAPEFDDYRRKVIACLRSTEKVLGMTQSRPERKR